MAWYDDIVSWAEPYIDTAAEYINYEDIVEIGTGQEYSAGRQLIDDASDAFGFIKQGAKAYGVLAGTIDPKTGRRVTGKQQVFQQTKFARQGARTLGQVKNAISGGGGTPQFNVSQGSTMATGAFNPQVQTAMAALLAGTNNVQMNNLLGSFAVSPNLGQGRKTSTGSTTLARKVKKTK
mgnify:CR=1 FL=1|tara:strand:- start:26 stop:562 length:537 start_codon:yes stop_codon:yes gene_type:complete